MPDMTTDELQRGRELEQVLKFAVSLDGDAAWVITKGALDHERDRVKNIFIGANFGEGPEIAAVLEAAAEQVRKRAPTHSGKAGSLGTDG